MWHKPCEKASCCQLAPTFGAPSFNTTSTFQVCNSFLKAWTTTTTTNELPEGAVLKITLQFTQVTRSLFHRFFYHTSFMFQFYIFDGLHHIITVLYQMQNRTTLSTGFIISGRSTLFHHRPQENVKQFITYTYTNVRGVWEVPASPVYISPWWCPPAGPQHWGSVWWAPSRHLEEKKGLTSFTQDNSSNL